MLLLRFKFGRDRRAGADLARLLEEPLRAVLSEASESLVVPVPVSSGTLKKRGFNQVEEVLTACSVSYTGLLERTGDKRHQVALGAEERAALVHGQYSVREDARKVLSGRQVVLVDDVLTTGSTMGEAARVLREAGAARVTGIAFFRESLF
jgi:ComF family protein